MRQKIITLLYFIVRAICGAVLLSTAAFVYFGAQGAAIGAVAGAILGVIFGYNAKQKNN